MTSADLQAAAGFRAGGTLPVDTRSYVTRPADIELFKRVKAGEFCYILTPRQMGKSSLMIRTGARLRRQGFRTAIVDLSLIGTEATSEQWFLGIVKYLQNELKLAVKPEQWWREHGTLGPAQRFDIFLHDVALAQIDQPIAVFVDEIDSTLKLPFADDFFAIVRHAYNRRAHDTAYGRLSFVLLGVVAPTDLIKDRNRTPFNIGHAIDLQEFSRADARPLEIELERLFPAQARRLLDRIFYWTGGHPYLTQKLCHEIAAAPARRWTDAEIDRTIAALFLTGESRKEDNLRFVISSVEASHERRRLLRLYRQVYTGEAVKENERSPIQNRLKLIGLVRAAGGTLQVRNEIYRQVFNLGWIKRNTPNNRLRIVTWAAIAAIVLAIGFAGQSAYRQRLDTIALLKDKYVQDRDAGEVAAQMYHLGQLCEQAQQEAQAMFFDQTRPQQQKQLFDGAAASTTTPDQLAATLDCLYPALDGHEADPRYAEPASAMCGAANRLNVALTAERRRRLCATGG